MENSPPPTKIEGSDTLCHVRTMLESGTYEAKTPLPCSTCTMKDTCRPMQLLQKDTDKERRSE